MKKTGKAKKERRTKIIPTGYSMDKTLVHAITHYPNDIETRRIVEELIGEWIDLAVHFNPCQIELLMNLSDHAGLIAQSSVFLKRKWGEKALRAYLFVGGRNEIRMSDCNLDHCRSYTINPRELKYLYLKLKPFIGEELERLIINTGMYLCLEEAFDRVYDKERLKADIGEAVKNLTIFDKQTFLYFARKSTFLNKPMCDSLIVQVNEYRKERKNKKNWVSKTKKHTLMHREFPHYVHFKPGDMQKNTILSDFVDEIPSGEGVYFGIYYIPDSFLKRQKKIFVKFSEYKLLAAICGDKSNSWWK